MQQPLCTCVSLLCTFQLTVLCFAVEAEETYVYFIDAPAASRHRPSMLQASTGVSTSRRQLCISG